MSTAKLLKTLNKVIPSNPTLISNHEIAEKLAKTLVSSGLKPLQATPSLLSNLNSHIIHLVLSNPHVPPPTCLSFFKFLQKNQSLTPQKPDLRAHVTLVWRLYGARKFAEMKNILNCIVADDNLRCPVSIIVSLIEEDGFSEPKFVGKL